MELHTPKYVKVLQYVVMILMALFMFWGSEILEKVVGKRDITKEPKWRYAAAATITVAAVTALW